MTSPGFDESGDQPRFAISAETACSIAAPPPRILPGTRTANSAQLSWNALGAVAGSLDRELREKGVRVALVCPAATETEFALNVGRIAGEPRQATFLRPDDVAFQIVQILRQPRTVRTHIWTLWSIHQPNP